jgi:hypothetical protein
MASKHFQLDLPLKVKVKVKVVTNMESDQFYKNKILKSVLSECFHEN